MSKNHKKTLYEKVNGKAPTAKHDDSIKNEPVRKFISFKEAQTLLGYEWRGSLENALSNGSIRFAVLSQGVGTFRAIYKPDVIKLKKIREN